MNHPMLIFFTFLFCVTLGFASEMFSLYPLKKWYSTKRKPKFHPKNSRLAHGWTISYAFMGIAIYFILTSEKPNTIAIIMFLIHFAMCLAWPILYFHKKDLKTSFYELCGLIVVSIVTTVLFWIVSIPGGILMIPCIPWIVFVTILNKKVWELNTEE